MTLRVATSDLGDLVPPGDLVPSVVSSPYIMYHSFQVYVVCSVLLFSVPKFSEEYDNGAVRVLALPYIFPLAYIGLMGSVYCTIAIAVERYLAVTYPFLPRR